MVATEIVEQCRDLIEDPEFPAVRRWLEENPGGKVLGHFQVYFPEEIAHAAGVLPIKLAGGMTIAQSEDTCVVSGMPRAAILKGYANKIIPLDGLAAYLVSQYGGERNPAEKFDKNEKNDKNEKQERTPVSSQRS